jgi:hypothetical protein
MKISEACFRRHDNPPSVLRRLFAGDLTANGVAAIMRLEPTFSTPSPRRGLLFTWLPTAPKRATSASALRAQLPLFGRGLE